jgi:dolichyl-phosphate-mannose--protein O-mannosyl transferase
MGTQRRERFVRGQVAWMVCAILALGLAGSLTLERFFAASLIGLVALVALIAPINVSPPWRTRLRWVLVAGLLAFTGLVIRHILGILPEGLV